MRNLLLALMLYATPVVAQDSVMVSVPRSVLTASQLASVEAQDIKAKANAYGAWVGVGKEIGEAVNSSLSAISDNAAKFADTKVGRFSMFIVAWKVLSDDIFGAIYTLIIVFIGLPILVWSYRRHLSVSVLDKEQIVDGKVTRTYRPMTYDERDVRGLALILHVAGAIVLLGAMSIAMFA